MSVLAGTPVVDTFVNIELAKKQKKMGMTIDSVIHREATKESLGKDWEPFEKMSQAAIERYANGIVESSDENCKPFEKKLRKI